MKVILLVVLLLWTAQSEAQTCNGSPDYCSLRFNQITLAGSHGAGAGFNRILKRCDGMPAQNCFFQNQDLSIEEQLNRGVRFLSLDVCILPNECNATAFGDLSMSRLVSCQGSEDMAINGFRYTGRLIDILQQTDNWLSNNTNEIIGLYFTRNIPSSDISRVGQMIASLLETKWGEGPSNVSLRSPRNLSATELSTFYTRNGNTWPTLMTAINENQRIIVYFDSEIAQGNIMLKPWLHPMPYVTPNPFTAPLATDITCRHLDNVVCNDTNSDTLVLSGFGFATCLSDVQMRCNSKLENAATTCFDSRITENRTANVILVDFVDMGPVFNITSELNRRNILRFLPPAEITTASTNGASITTRLDTNMGIPSTTEYSSGTSAVHYLSYTLSLLVLNSIGIM